MSEIEFNRALLNYSLQIQKQTLLLLAEIENLDHDVFERAGGRQLTKNLSVIERKARVVHYAILVRGNYLDDEERGQLLNTSKPEAM